MHNLTNFTVQACKPGRGEIKASNTCINVVARGPVDAAERVLGEKLSVSGKIVKAKVWKLNDSYIPVAVTLYQ